MGSVGTRLRQLREDSGKTREDLAQFLGVSYSTVSKYETDQRAIGNVNLSKLAEYFGVTTDFILGKTQSLDILNLLDDNQTQLIAAGRPLTPDQRVNLIRALDPDMPAPTTQIPIIATIRAGIPIFTEEHIYGLLDVDADTQADFAVRVTGDSMLWAGIHEGDYALCRESEAAHTGQMVVAAVEDPAASDWGGTIKYFVQANGRKILRAANPDYKDIDLDNGDRIVGVVVAVLKSEPPALHMYEELLAGATGRGSEWASLAVTAASLGWTPGEIENLVRMMAKMPRPT